MMYFLHTGRQLSFASSVHYMHLCAQTKCCSGSIHGNVSAAYNCYLLAQVDWRIVIITEGLHQVASGQILVGREYTVGVLTWNSHELGKSCAGTDEYGDQITCGAGVKNSELKKIMLEKGLGGLEFLCSIPGVIGGSVTPES